ncbi:diguanylate cyclase domain-containing protein [Winogradskya humida]|uniref:Diguanylate cyclase (GGDEF)-like protein n=1 Tax=Winogradskya humida TaxID=113566 RepID=A0ABQ4A651_9ACTN|nr:diguanylate cyclase [Actinoplanes humidus]GIE26331.1 hypothetical protein Ahu01nite_094330 [Actinoplanes humidus]
MSIVQNRSPRRRLTSLVAVVLVLAAGCAVTVAAYVAVRDGETRYAGQVMDRYIDDITETVADRVARYGSTLSDLAYAIGAQTDLEADDFTRISTGLDATRLPGASGIGFVVTASTTQIPSVQRTWRTHGAPGLTLKPAAGISAHNFVIFEKAFDDREDMQGTDLSISAPLASALDTARHSGTLAISPAYQLLRDRWMTPEQRQTSVVLAAPVYTGLGSSAPDEFIGWVVMGLRGQDFLGQTLLGRSQKVVQISITDTTAGDALIAAIAPGRRVSTANLERQQSTAVAQRRWHVTVWPTTRLLASTDRGMSRLTLAAGIALSVLLAMLAGVLTGSRNRALEQVERATTELRRDIDRREQVEARLHEREQQLQQLAFHDPLTGLANRLLFYDRLTHALATHARGNRVFAVLFIDLDGFKQVNDQRGHNAGDTVLQVVADRLRTGLRASDTVARFGGDEFAIIIESLTGIADARPTAERIIGVVQEPIDIDGTPAQVSASVGIAVNHPGVSADDLIREADAAMYTAKTSGKNRYAEAGTAPH